SSLWCCPRDLLTILHTLLVRNNFQQNKVHWNLSVIISSGLYISLSHTGLAKRASLILRPTSLKSLVANASPENANANANGEQLPIAAAMLIRLQSVYGDLHGVQLAPVAAEILRK
ncbi:hypothetical protein Tco_1137672, partial [Tanacetum coccineum]